MSFLGLPLQLYIVDICNYRRTLDDHERRLSEGNQGVQERVAGLAWVLLLTLALLVSASVSAGAFDPEETFTRGEKVLSVEGSLAYFGPRLPPGSIQAWSLGARFSLLPFGVAHFERLHNIPDGALELGVEPIFERFSSHQNFGGVGFEVRYYFTHLRYGPLVPWIVASVAPGGSDLDVGSAAADERLTGPFLTLIQLGAGLACFITDHSDIYVGFQAQHASNAGFNGRSLGASRNIALNTPWNGVAGVSWFLP